MDRANQIEITLHDVVAIIRRRSWALVGPLVVCLCASILITHFSHRIYEARSEIDIKTPTAQAQSASLLTSLAMTPDTFKHTQLLLLTNPWMLERIAVNLRNRDHVTEPFNLGSDLVAKDDVDTELIDIYARSRSPKTAQIIANETVLTFREYLSDVDGEAARRALSTMESRVAQARVSMERSSQKLAAFQTEFGILDLDKQTDANITEMAAARTAEEQSKQDLAAAEASVEALQQQLQKQNALIQRNGVRSDQGLEALQEQINQAESRLAAARETYVDNPDAVASLEDTLGGLRQQLRRKLSTVTGGSGGLLLQEQLLGEMADAQRQAAALRDRYKSVTAGLDREVASNKRLPYLERTLQQLAQNAAVDRDLYQKTLEGFEQIDMDRVSQPSVVQITGLATQPTSPVLPQPRSNYAFALVLGLIAGLSLAALLERADTTIHNEQEFRRVFPVVNFL